MKWWSEQGVDGGLHEKKVWNQGLVNLDFDDNKIRFRTNDYFQVWLDKTISKVAITKTNQVKDKS